MVQPIEPCRNQGRSTRAWRGDSIPAFDSQGVFKHARDAEAGNAKDGQQQRVQSARAAHWLLVTSVPSHAKIVALRIGRLESLIV